MKRQSVVFILVAALLVAGLVPAIPTGAATSAMAPAAAPAVAEIGGQNAANSVALGPAAYFPPTAPSVTEVGKYLVISMGSDANVGRAFQMSNTEIGADRKIISTASDLGCPTNGGFPDLTGQFAAGRWNLTTDPDSLNLAATLFQGTDWSGEVALTSSGGKTDSSNSLVFADIGIQSASSDPLGGSVSSSYHFDLTENAPCSNADPLVLGDGATANNNFTPLLTQLTAWKTYITGLAAEVTINNYSAWTNNAASNGNGGLRTNYDSNDTNGDGIVVINLADTGNDFSVNNTDWVINGSGSKLIIFRLTGGRNMVMSNASITLGDSGIANGGMGVIFYTSYKGSGNTDAVFSGSNLIASGVGFWDLNVVGQGGSTGTNIVVNNGQGCAQFISQKVNFQNNRWNRCAPAEAAAADLAITKAASPNSAILGQNLSYTLIVTNTGSGGATGVTVTDTLPSDVSFVSANASQGGCSQSAGVVTCNLGALASGGSATITIVVTVNATPAGTIGSVKLGGLTDHLLFFADARTDANWQGATKGFVGDVAVDGRQAAERTSGTVPYAGTIFTNDSTLAAWQGIVNANVGQASGSTGNLALISQLETTLNAAFLQINALPATSGYSSVSATSLDGLDTTNGVAETYVINVTSGLGISSQIDITGDAGDVFVLRWDTDANFSDGYEGQVKFQSGGAIVPHGGLKPSSFIHVAGDIGSSGGGSTPASPYPQGPRLNDGTGALCTGCANFSGGGFFTGYWLTTGSPDNAADGAHSVRYGESSSLSNGIFVGGWYSINTKFSMTSGTSGVYVSPPVGAACPSGELRNVASVTGNETDNVLSNNTDDICVPVTVATLDYGDAPDGAAGTAQGNYNTVATDLGPSHVIVADLRLGANAPDADPGILQNVGADADDTNDTDDEDGVMTLPSVTTTSTSVPLSVSVFNNTGSPATLACWLDFDRDGDFGDTGERAATTVSASASQQTASLTFTGFAAPTAGASYLRCRLATAAGDVTNPTGAANTGEVEDYALVITVPLPAIDVEKDVSVDGQATWLDADAPAGPTATVGSPVYFRFTVTNIGKVALNAVVLTDTIFNLSGCPIIPSALLSGATYTCIYGPVAALLGQHANTANVAAIYAGVTASDSDLAHYLGEPAPMPSIIVEKEVSVNNQATWLDADAPVGPAVTVGAAVYFRFTVTNNGNVTLTNVMLSDSDFAPLTGCAVPDTLNVGQSYQCVYGPVPAVLDQHANTATVTGVYNSTTYSDADMAHYYGEPVPQGVIGDYVWNDTNGDGLQNEGPGYGIDGVILTLYRDDGDNVFEPGAGDTLVMTQTTAADGGYQFTNVVPGAYWVDVAAANPALAGYTFIPGAESGPDPKLVTMGPNDNYTTADFGYVGKGGISGVVFYDWNSDGTQGLDEDPIPNTDVCLYRDNNRDGLLDAGDTQLTCMTTDGSGAYAFAGQVAGAYLVVQTQPAGLQDTTPNVLPVSLVVIGPSGSAPDNNFGEIVRVRFGDFVWVDIDSDGVQDPGENTGLTGVPLHIVGADLIGNVVDVILYTALGNYLEVDLLPGNYTVTAPDVFKGYALTSPDALSTTLTITNTQDLTLDFGYAYPTGIPVQDLAATAAQGQVTVAWRTLLEEDNQGFSIWRADQPNGPFVKLNAEVLPSQGPNGGEYSFVDTTVKMGRTYWYHLRTEPGGYGFGPVSVRVGSLLFLPQVGR